MSSSARAATTLGLRWLALTLIRFYRQAISPSLPRACRFTPSCAAYAEEAVARRPLPRALWLIARRISKCHPFHRGGYDPVP
jgi:putative membrane protein insertion efficiency factor